MAVVRHPDRRTDEERAWVARLKELAPDVRTAVETAEQLAEQVRERNGAGLDEWEERADAIPTLRAFAAGLRRDGAAVRVGLTLPWSNGPVEGAVNRLTLLTRAGYGRANFDLLRARVLHSRRPAQDAGHGGAPAIARSLRKSPLSAGVYDARVKEVLWPQCDHGFPAVVEDLHQRGMLDETLVVAVGEMGRTPTFNPQGGRAHRGNVWSFLLAGAGIRTGQVVGASDRRGAEVGDGKVTHSDLTATTAHLLGIGHDAIVRDKADRPHRVTDGDPIRAALA